MTNTHLNDLFDRMEKEEGNELDDKIQVTEDPLIKEVAESFNAWTNFVSRNILSSEEEFQSIHNNFSNQYTSKEITKISTYLSCLPYLTDSFLGFFFNALVQKSKDQNHTIYAPNTPTQISYLGYQNTKNITIFGDVGRNTGYEMISGSMTINGNVGSYVGHTMSGGEIIVNGNTESLPGYGMKGGTLIINGDTEDYTGIEMKKGEIHVNGKLNNTYRSNVPGGKIYQNGTLAFYKGYPTPKKIILDIKKHIKQKLTK